MIIEDIQRAVLLHLRAPRCHLLSLACCAGKLTPSPRPPGPNSFGGECTWPLLTRTAPVATLGRCRPTTARTNRTTASTSAMQGHTPAMAAGTVLRPSIRITRHATSTHKVSITVQQGCFEGRSLLFFVWFELFRYDTFKRSATRVSVRSSF